MFTKIKLFIKNYFLSRRSYQFFIRDWLPLADLQKSIDILSTMRFSQNLKPLLREGPNAKRILVIAPHPDDETIGPGGTLLREIRKGAEVTTLYLTCGAPDTAENLKIEANAIAQKYGYKTIFLNYFSKNIPLNSVIISEFSNVVNDVKPDVLFLPFLLDDHDDHRRASHLLLMSKNAKTFKCSFDVWAYQVYTVLPPNVIVDITDLISEKENMINLWCTQNKTRNWAHFTLGLNAFNQRFLPNDSKPKYAEGFFALPLEEYINYCTYYFEKPSQSYYVSHYRESS